MRVARSVTPEGYAAKEAQHSQRGRNSASELNITHEL